MCYLPMQSPYQTKQSIFSISNLHATKFWMILCCSASEFICRRRKVLPFNLLSLLFAVILRADVCLLILPSSCAITSSTNWTSAWLAQISSAALSLDFCSKAFLAHARISFFALRTSHFLRMLAMAQSALFLLCPEMKSMDNTVSKQSYYECGAEASCASICAFHLCSRVDRGTPDCWSLCLASI